MAWILADMKELILILLDIIMGIVLWLSKKTFLRDTGWGTSEAQLVKRLPLAQVMILESPGRIGLPAQQGAYFFLSLPLWLMIFLTLSLLKK